MSRTGHISWRKEPVLDNTAFGAIWDLDGTLVDTERNHYLAWHEFMREHGRDLTHEQFRPTFGMRNDDVLVGHLGFDPSTHDLGALGERKEELFRASLEREGVRMQRGAQRLVEHFRRVGARQVIASSAPPGNIDLIVRLIGLGDLFEAVVSSEEVKHGKPAPDIVLLAAQHLALPPHRCVVLEDAPAGISAGKAAGSKTIAIDATFPRDYLVEADLIVHTFDEVLWPSGRWAQLLAS